ncbi:hypothetical protein P7D52_10480 [Enterococcus dongliensis]|uniref:hypothetical protein n=1 Tax=Enterococcus dongliensis TaxID=2559925 RepID=UPI00289085D8|nr:hypothetical protein [Enterococcus dongliensis]MDT2643212.1 hypothetical protein [Enterococcus dongliensis]
MIFLKETVLPVMLGVLPVKIMFTLYEQVIKSDLKVWKKIALLPVFIVAALSVVAFIGWLLFIKLDI